MALLDAYFVQQIKLPTSELVESPISGFEFFPQTPRPHFSELK